MRLVLMGKARDVFGELSLLVRLEKELGHALTKLRVEPWDNIQN